MRLRLTALLLVLAFTLLAVAPGTAAPQAGPCTAGTSYDPACDVNHDGVIDVLDIQLAAGRWNQSGVWTSDNDHDHLGQTWTGSNNPLIIEGSFGAPHDAPLYLSNGTNHGVVVESAGKSGVVVKSAGSDGFRVDSAGADGMWVVSAGDDGVHVFNANDEGVYISFAGGDGLYVHSAFYSGLVVNDAGNDGVLVREATNWAGRFIGNVSISGNCVGCLQANFAVNAGERALQPGDAVTVQAMTAAGFDAAQFLWQVAPAQPGQAAVGVVAGRAELVAEAWDAEQGDPPAQPGQHLAPRAGAAQPGEYLAVVYSGPMQVRVAPGEEAITGGTRLTAAADGAVRPLATRIVDGMAVSEGAPALGIALEPAEDGLVWVLVNPQ